MGWTVCTYLHTQNDTGKIEMGKILSFAGSLCKVVRHFGAGKSGSEPREGRRWELVLIPGSLCWSYAVQICATEIGGADASRLTGVAAVTWGNSSPLP